MVTNKLVKYMNKRRAINLGNIAAAYRIGKAGYGFYKKYMARRKARRTPTNSTYVPDWKGRTMTKVKITLPKTSKKLEKKCMSLKKQKLILYKNAIVNKCQRVYYYEGVYKAIERGAYDNFNYQLNFLGGKSRPNNPVYGGSLGFGRASTGAFGSDLVVANAYETQHGNVLAWDCDLPTGHFLSDTWYNDLEPVAGTSYSRQFGMLAQPIYGKRELVATNDSNEKTIVNSPIPLDQQIGESDILGVVTLQWEYQITFRNLSKMDFIGYVVLFKLNKFWSPDSTTMKGLSNFINYYRTQTAFHSDDDILDGKFPYSMMKIVKVKKVYLNGTYNTINTDQGKALKSIKIRSSKAYCTVARRPTTQTQTTASTVTNVWWNDEYHKHTYCMAYAIPVGHEIGPGTSDVYSAIPAGEVQCIVEKRTAYCTIK